MSQWLGEQLNACSGLQGDSRGGPSEGNVHDIEVASVTTYSGTNSQKSSSSELDGAWRGLGSAMRTEIQININEKQNREAEPEIQQSAPKMLIAQQKTRLRVTVQGIEFNFKGEQLLASNSTCMLRNGLAVECSEFAIRKCRRRGTTRHIETVLYEGYCPMERSRGSSDISVLSDGEGRRVMVKRCQKPDDEQQRSLLAATAENAWQRIVSSISGNEYNIRHEVYTAGNRYWPPKTVRNTFN
ncbi:hypothetical protein C8R44DRAFT_923991 [Mycena epipterygia]|nr:hypothetical protein C8R44DRAFT_923991 [Mycena epipterygia]